MIRSNQAANLSKSIPLLNWWLFLYNFVSFLVWLEQTYKQVPLLRIEHSLIKNPKLIKTLHYIKSDVSLYFENSHKSDDFIVLQFSTRLEPHRSGQYLRGVSAKSLLWRTFVKWIGVWFWSLDERLETSSRT